MSSTYTEAYLAAKARPVRLAEMVETIDETAAAIAASQRALLAANLRVAPHEPTVRHIVALETAMEVLAALESDPDLAKQVSKRVAAKRKDFDA